MMKMITGLPGSGKTLRLIGIIRKYLEENRPVFVDGVKELEEFGWRECDATKWVDLPDGSVVIVDEADRRFPQRRTGEPPAYVRELARHRHRGFDFVFVTQRPNFVDTFVRGLVGEHEHLIRQFGTNASRVITWQGVQEDPNSPTAIARGTESLWFYPSSDFALYKSASLHTVKRRIPKRLLILPVLIVIALGAFWYGYHVLKDKLGGKDATVVGASGAEAPAASKPRSSAFGGERVKYRTAEEFLIAMRPRVSAMPWSAPAFDSRSVASKPEVYCIQSEARGCTCYSEQITRLEVPTMQCLTIARIGIYNPFREPMKSERAFVDGEKKRDQKKSDTQVDEWPALPVRPTRRVDSVVLPAQLGG